jgi:cytidylate kinase
MKNFLINYLEEPDVDRQEVKNETGPVVTISRECGCSANRIAIKLSKILSGYSYLSASKKDVEWTWVNKEVIEKAATELEMDQEQVKNVFLGEVKTSIHDVSTAFSVEKVYDAEDQKVIDTVTKIIGQLAQKGHCVIVGRAASVVSQTNQARLNVKLQAPLEWRIRRIMKISNMAYPDAEYYVKEVDRQRDLFVEHIAGHKLNSSDFDMLFNTATMDDDLIVDAIVNVLKNKGII